MIPGGHPEPAQLGAKRTSARIGGLRLDRVPTELYHYSCQHTADRVGAAGELLPSSTLRELNPPNISAAHRAYLDEGPWAPIGRVVWFTDLAHPGSGPALGFDRILDRGHGQTCDRLAYRYRVDDAYALVCSLAVRWWPAYARVIRFRQDLRDELEGGGARPAHWFVSAGPVRVTLDLGWKP